jgi:hypothetical protein
VSINKDKLKDLLSCESLCGEAQIGDLIGRLRRSNFVIPANVVKSKLLYARQQTLLQKNPLLKVGQKNPGAMLELPSPTGSTHFTSWVLPENVYMQDREIIAGEEHIPIIIAEDLIREDGTLALLQNYAAYDTKVQTGIRIAVTGQIAHAFETCSNGAVLDAYDIEGTGNGWKENKSEELINFRGGDLITTSLQTVNEKKVIYIHAQFPCILSHTRALT